jgi:hypothetical protein
MEPRFTPPWTPHSLPIVTEILWVRHILTKNLPGLYNPFIGPIGKTEELEEKACRCASLPTRNPTWIQSDANLGLRCERSATDHLNHVVAFVTSRCKLIYFYS